MDHNINENELEITFPVASSEPYPRIGSNGRYDECLVISPDAVNMERLNGGASVLKNHDPDRILGTVRKAWIESGKLLVQCAFRKNDAESANIFRDIADGTMRNVSIGYTQDEVSFRRIGDRLIGDVVRWTPLEVSVAVGVPADPTVGFFRSFELNKGDNPMSEEKKTEAPAVEERKIEEPAPAPEAPKAEERKAEQPEVKPEELKAETPVERKETELKNDAVIIRHICEVFECPEKAEDAIQRGLKPEELKAELRESLKPKIEVKSIVNHKPKGIETMENKYSFARALQSLVNPDVDASAERAASDELMRSIGMTPSRKAGIMLAFREGEFINADGNGAGLVGTDHRADLFIHSLRTRMGVKGATILSGLTQPIDIPTQTGAVTIGVGALNSSAGRTKPTVGKTSLSPKKFSAEVVIGEDLLVQGNPDAIAFVIDDLQAQIARKLDLAILKGIADPAIAGVDATTGVQTQVIASLASTTWADVLGMYGKVADYEIEDGDLAFIGKGTTKATLMGISKDSGSGRFLCEDGKINGYEFNVCGGLTSDDLYFGCWKNVFIGQWGGLQVKVDDVTGISEGSVKIVAKLLADIAITNPASFVKRVASVSA